MLSPVKVRCATKLWKVHHIKRPCKIGRHRGRNLFRYIGLEQKNLIGFIQPSNPSQTHQHGVNSMINMLPIVKVFINVRSYTDSIMT